MKRGFRLASVTGIPSSKLPAGIVAAAERCREEEIARMTAQCREVDYDHKTQTYTAVIWCNTTGEYLAGRGKTVLEAVEQAHAIKVDTESGKGEG